MPNNTIFVCVAGVTGWVGAPLAVAIEEADDLELVAAVSRNARGQRLGSITISGSVDEALKTQFDVFIDYTSATAVRENVLKAIAAQRHVVVGSSGLAAADYAAIDAAAIEQGVGVLAVGNFAVSAALLQRFAAEAAKHMPSWEIVDTANAGKIDAPSGTARELAWRLSQVGAPETEVPIEKSVGPKEARGADVDGSRIHSIRLPGYIIKLEVRFGREDERLTIEYEGGPSAQPYIAGTLLAVRRVREFRGVVRGLDRIL